LGKVHGDWHPGNMLFSWQQAKKHRNEPWRWFVLIDFDRTDDIGGKIAK
jgi:predicted unusual protein kinase regulating ubiquinone biosynthesis (AarF/ABC1/UbiB family)